MLITSTQEVRTSWNDRSVVTPAANTSTRRSWFYWRRTYRSQPQPVRNCHRGITGPSLSPPPPDPHQDVLGYDRRDWTPWPSSLRSLNWRHLVSMGIYSWLPHYSNSSRRAFPFGWTIDVPDAGGRTHLCTCSTHNGMWLDICRVDDFIKAQECNLGRASPVSHATIAALAMNDPLVAVIALGHFNISSGSRLRLTHAIGYQS